MNSDGTESISKKLKTLDDQIKVLEAEKEKLETIHNVRIQIEQELFNIHNELENWQGSDDFSKLKRIAFQKLEDFWIAKLREINYSPPPPPPLLPSRRDPSLGVIHSM
jgi:hypothetical protein